MQPFQTPCGRHSGRCHLRGWVVVFFLCLVLGSGLGPAPAQAIPAAGDYVFVSGDPNISGSFTSTGSMVSTWSFSSDIFNRLFAGPSFPPATLSWSSQSDVVNGLNLNNTHSFSTSNSTDLGGLGNDFIATFAWNTNQSILNAKFGVFAACCDAVYQPIPMVSFVSAPKGEVSIPDNATIVFMAAAYSAWPSISGGGNDRSGCDSRRPPSTHRHHRSQAAFVEREIRPLSVSAGHSPVQNLSIVLPD